MAAKWWPNSTLRSVGTKSLPLSRASAGVARSSRGLTSLRSISLA
ncbi:Uncharacterised protein [Mycobacteroides abscessus subsp. abscessus]|nr:Uncharacterised protein [Mycobacteroides abscessus subsp. abscessus]SKU65321.1 Uncharacterised protein [Mycobacteroides abscessus subsp. abscessus]